MDSIKNSNMTRLVIIHTLAIVIKRNSNRKYPQILLKDTISGSIRDPCLKDNTTTKSQHSNVFLFNTFQWPPTWMARHKEKLLQGWTSCLAGMLSPPWGGIRFINIYIVYHMLEGKPHTSNLWKASISSTTSLENFHICRTLQQEIQMWRG